MRALLLLLTLAACEKSLLTPDASSDAPVMTADAPTTCPAVTTTTLPAGHFKLFVNTEGVDIAKCSADNAPTNCSTIPPGNVTFPQFLPGDPNRQPFIDAIVVRVQDKLAPYSVDVVTTRPTSGDYYMAVLGGDGTLVGSAAGLFSIAPAVCDFGNRDHVTFEFDRGRGVGYNDYAVSILSDLGASLGLAGNSVAGDCMCRSNCTPPDVTVCAWGSDVPVTTDPAHNCGRTTQDEPMLLTEALGCR